MYGLPLLHAGLPVPGDLLRVVGPAAADAEVRYVLRAAEPGQSYRVLRGLPRQRNQDRRAGRPDRRSAPADRREAGPVLQQDLRHSGGRRHVGVLPVGRALRADRPPHQRPQRGAPGNYLARSGNATRCRIDGRCSAGRNLVDFESPGGSGQSGGPPQMKLPKLTVWRAIFAAILLSGVYATYLRIFKGLGGSTNLSDQFPWGIWIGFDVMCGVGLAAGGFTLVAIVHIFNIEKYRPVLRPSILTAFLGYLLVVVGLLYDLGRPDRLWHPLVMWNPHSVMFEVAWCVTLYSTVLFLEFIPVVFERWGWHKPMEWIH